MRCITVDKDKTILLIEDDKDLRLIIHHTLKTDFNVLEAEDSLTGLSLLKDNKVDFIILDVMLPDLNGYALCRLLKGNANYKDIPVMIYTARDGSEEMSMAKAVGADYFDVKNGHLKQTIDTVKAIVKGGIHGNFGISGCVKHISGSTAVV